MFIHFPSGVAHGDTFSEMYPAINGHLAMQPIINSRAGEVREVLDFKTKILNPYRRCVGGFGRNINVFFLLAEAVWIAAGKKDVRFLTLFNSNMSDFSDDGVVFHAPYGHRLRHWGVRAEDSSVSLNLSSSEGRDQLEDAVRLLSDNPDTRQVVMSIWNPEFDLGIQSKDLPCNDMVMFKIRGNKLITTIQNRSNDLHWGLPTNVFQFSFLAECVASCLGVKMGSQTHNSQSLHIYEWNPITERMLHNTIHSSLNLYDIAEERRMDFNFSTSVAANRLRELDFFFNIFIENLTKVADGNEEDSADIENLKGFSAYLYDSYRLCRLYLQYKGGKDTVIDKNEFLRSNIDIVDHYVGSKWDIGVLAKNFFAARVTDGYNHDFLGRL